MRQTNLFRKGLASGNCIEAAAGTAAVHALVFFQRVWLRGAFVLGHLPFTL